jgi:hypothetical protein
MHRSRRLLAALFALVVASGCDSLLSPPIYGSLRVKVVSRNGAPVAGVPVTVYFVQQRLVLGTTDAEGSFTFERLPENKYGVFNDLIDGYSRPEIVRPGPRTDFVDEIKVTRGATASAQMTLLKIGPGTIVAKVSDPAGAGVSGIRVSLYSGAGGTVREGTTGANGTFTFADVPFGDWGVTAARPAQYRDSAETPTLSRDALIIDDGALANANFTFAPCSGAIAATIRDNTGAPVTGSKVALYQFGVDRDSGAVDANAARTFGPLPCEDFGMRVTSVPIGWNIVPGRGFSFIDGLFVHRNATRTAPLRVQRVACRGLIRATVTDNTSAGVNGAEVVVYTGDIQYKRITTPSDGVVSFGDLPCDRTWGVFVIPPPSHALGAVSFFDGIVLTNGATIDRAFVLTKR